MLGRKLNRYMSHKKVTLTTKIKQKHFTDMFMILNTATISIFKQPPTYVNRVQ